VDPNKDKSKMDWKGLQAQASEVLGAEFWQDMASLIPITGPRIDMYETAKQLVIIVEVPGLTSREQIGLSIHEFSLLIRGSLVRPYGVLEENMILKERFFGTFERTLRLSPRAIVGEMKAFYQNGLLIIQLPIAPSTEATQIPIQF
jgi:HSP20 family protein